jgi:hypothetical protein
MKYKVGDRIVDSQGNKGVIIGTDFDYKFENGKQVSTKKYKIKYDDHRISWRMEDLIKSDDPSEATNLVEEDFKFIDDLFNYMQLDLALSYGDKDTFNQLTQVDEQI